MRENPLVSIVVITYNSSKYVIETLESCKNQTYGNIELIISDDASTDDTIEKCEEWLSENSERFVSFRLIKHVFNTGVSANLNRGVFGSSGEWFKLCSGDDLLHRKCIETYVGFIDWFKDAQVICLPKKHFRNKDSKYEFKKSIKNHSLFFDSRITVNQQLMLYLRHIQIPPVVGLFIRKSVFVQIGGCDERFKMQEDRPLIMRILQNGFKIHGQTNPALYFYRIHSKSLNMFQKNERYVTDWMAQSYLPVVMEYLAKNLPRVERIAYYYQYLLIKLTYVSIINKKKGALRWVYPLLDWPRRKFMNFFAKYYKAKITDELDRS